MADNIDPGDDQDVGARHAGELDAGLDVASGLLSPATRRLSLAVYSTIALIAFEGTSVAAALPDLAADLGNVGRLPWIITAFLFTLGLSTIVAGPLVDAVGPSRLFRLSVIVFAGSGFIAGFASNLDVLIAIRLVQGSASGMLFAATIAAVNLGFPEHLTGRAFAANSTIWGVMGAAAPAIAAALLNVASWRWIFFVNLPLGLFALVAGRNAIPGRQPGAEPLSIDGRGTVLAAVFTLATLAAVDQLGLRSIVYGTIAVASAIAYGLHARREPRPVVSLQHLAAQPYRSLALVPALMMMAAFSANVYITVYVAAGRDVSTTTAAWSVIFFTVGWTLGANLSSLALDRTSAVNVMSAGLAVSIAGLVVAAPTIAIDGSLAVVFAGLVLLGVGIGLTTNASLIMLRAETAMHQIGRASAANQFARSQGLTLGAAAGGSILLFVVSRRLGSVEPVRRLLAGEDRGENVDEAVAKAVRDGFAAVSIVALIVIVFAIPLMISLRRYERNKTDGIATPTATAGVAEPS